MNLPTSQGLYAYTGGRSFDPARPTVVFIHGAEHDHSVWSLQSRYLAHHGCSVLAFDLPGHMRSAGPALASVEAMADRLHDSIEASGARRVLVVGHSMGALIALELARRLGKHMLGAALVSAAFPMSVSDALLAATRDDASAAMDMINVWSHSASTAAFERKPSNPGPGFSIVWQNLRLMQRIAQRDGPAVLATDFAACNVYAGGIDAARELRCPVLFILGSLDVMTAPKAAKPLVDACADATVVPIDGGGHSLMAERPDEVLEALKAFAARVLAQLAEPAR
jgi:pimeloyl-ACP methyl ester carboxylesterase